LDIATGGGIPLNKLTIIYGNEGCGKTNTSLVYIREAQKMFPDKTCVFVDIEGDVSTDWAKKIGVDVTKLVILKPDYAEQAIDIICDLIDADDSSLIVVDSIAALISMTEIAKSAEKEQPGLLPRTMNKLVRKTTVALNQATKEGRCPTMIWINQIRMKIGVMFGNPETMPGGAGQKFMANLILRLYAKPVVDSKVSKSLPVAKETHVSIKKWKQPIIATDAEYNLAMLPHAGLSPGTANNWPVARQYLNDLGLMIKSPKGYVFKPSGEEFPTQKALWEWLSDTVNLETFKNQVVQELIHNDYNEA
jgi:recombination protein RecA